MMTVEEAQELLAGLRSKELKEVYVKKEDFLVFRKELVCQEDFKHFRGIGQRGGDVLYEYMDTARS